jgi:hypothetical protein
MATHIADSCSQAHVQAKVTAAASGDVIYVPDGVETWTAGLNWPAGKTLQILAINKHGPKITWGVAAPLIRVQQSQDAGGVSRLSGFEFSQDVGVDWSNYWNSGIYADGSNQFAGWARIDNCKFNTANRVWFRCQGALGIMDYCDFPNPGSICGYVFHPNWNGNSWSDGSWADPVNWNDYRWWVYDHCTANRATSYAFCDGWGGCRYIVRDCTFTNLTIEVHGTESGQRERGGRAIQVYRNQLTLTNGVAMSEFVNLRSGAGLVWNNTIVKQGNGWLTSMLKLECYRARNSFTPWGGATGVNAWDLNDTTGGNGSGLYASGTHNGGLQYQDLIDTTANFPTSFVGDGYIIHNVTTGLASRVQSRTSATTLRYADAFNYGGPGSPGGQLIFNNGDVYHIRRIIAALDMGGAGLCDLLDSPFYPTPRWLNQVPEKSYLYNNTDATLAASFSAIKSGIHYENGSLLAGYVPFDVHPAISGETPPPPPPPGTPNTFSPRKLRGKRLRDSLLP